MRLLLITLIFLNCTGYSQCLKICSWNIANLGKSKTDETISFIAKTLKDFDFVSIQEVSTSPAGAQAVAKIADELNRRGSKWEYSVSNPTDGKGPERYAFMWKISRVKVIKKAWLEKSLAPQVDREPYAGLFCSGKDTFLIGNMHAVPKGKNPDLETCHLFKIDEMYEKYHFMIMGDFNSAPQSIGFGTLLKRNVLNAFSGQKTTLKQEVSRTGEHLASEYDNIFYEADEIVLNDKGVLDFSNSFPDLKTARKVSDHIPVWGCFSVKRK